MRIHLGHHFYGAGNLGDDFMLAGFFAAMRTLAPAATYSCCVPFPLAPLQARFPQVEWLPCESDTRRRAIAACDVWLGLGGSPFQHALSRWFLDHLVGEAEVCAAAGKPMFFLGVGVQTTAELDAPEVRQLCRGASGIWTRDSESASRLAALASMPRVTPATDLAHVFFQAHPPPAAVAGRVTLVPNFDYRGWPGRTALLAGIGALAPRERVWLAQESRELPGAERTLYATLPDEERQRWRLIIPERPSAPLQEILPQWPSGEWLVTARYHAALAGGWSRSRVVVVGINEKLRAAARELGCPVIAPDADAATVGQALAAANTAAPNHDAAATALAACADFVGQATRSTLARSS